jgi:hypothetical protein
MSKRPDFVSDTDAGRVAVDLIPVISTGHLTMDEANPPDANAFPTYAMVGEFGFVIYAGPSSDWGDDECREAFPNLARCVDWAHGNGFRYLRIDCDAEAIDGLEVFEW